MREEPILTGPQELLTAFIDIAEEAAISRLYGGIHYREAIYNGLEQGYAIGRNVNGLDFGN